MAQEKQRKEHQEKYDKWSIENAQADEKFNEMLKKERAGGQTKPCPKCKQPLTKNGGCDHMTCTARCPLALCFAFDRLAQRQRVRFQS